MSKSIRDQLNELAEEKYRSFTFVLTPGKENILGVRLPSLRKLAKQIVKGDLKVDKETKNLIRKMKRK